MASQVREAVAAFHSVGDMEAAIDELLTSGFDRSELSLLASQTAIEAKLHRTVVSNRDLEDDPEAPSVPYLARESFGSLEGYSIGLPFYVGAVAGFVPVMASGGAIAAVIAAAALVGGAGAAIGGVLAAFIAKHHADFLETQLRSGGILLWVRTRDGDHERRALDILARHAGDDVHVHGLPDETGKLTDLYTAKVPDKMTVFEHQNIQVSKAPDGHCIALGRLFPSEAEARLYIDRFQAEV